MPSSKSRLAQEIDRDTARAIAYGEQFGRVLDMILSPAKPAEKPRPEYPEFCRHPEKCIARGRCASDPVCND